MKQMTEQELLAADVMSLSKEQIEQRITIINLRAAERASEHIANENAKFQEQKNERERMRRVALDNQKKEQEKIQQEQQACSHCTGGEGYQGWFSGDGSIYGSATAVLTLPTSETYILCFRCQREVHHPRWPKLWPDGKTRTGMRAVIEGLMKYSEYQAQEREYNEWLRKPRKSFSPLNGQNCEASQFRLPALERLMAKDQSDFEEYVRQKFSNAQSNGGKF
jgi:hypothetical protein